MKKIYLTQGQVALVDDEDFERLSHWSWCAHKDARSGKFYAKRGVRAGGSRTIFLHQEVMGSPRGKRIDHINHNRLDCRKKNLRPCTHIQNSRNRSGPQASSTSGVRGVTWKKEQGKWYAQITVSGKNIYLGYFAKKSDAAAAYKRANRIYFGHFGGRVAFRKTSRRQSAGIGKGETHT